MEICGQPSLPLPANQHVDFVAIDFETATSDPNSACAVGLAFVVGLEVVATTHRLIQPPGNQYAQGNIHVHGISPEDTEHGLSHRLAGTPPHAGRQALIAHNARFDMSVIKAPPPDGDPHVQQYADFKYIDSIAMARDLVPGRKNLAACAQCLGVELSHHHNAECDAVACAQIAITCIKANHCLNLGEFCFSQPHIRIQELSDLVLPVRTPTPVPRDGTPVGPQYHPNVHPKEIRPQVTFFDPTTPSTKKSLVFTGELSIDRREAMQRAVNVGAIIKTAVSRKTDFLVVGRQYNGPGGTATVSNKGGKGPSHPGRGEKPPPSALRAGVPPSAPGRPPPAPIGAPKHRCGEVISPPSRKGAEKIEKK